VPTCCTSSTRWRTARPAGLELRPDLRPATGEGDPLLLERLERNLVDNAIHYNLPVGGWMRVSLGKEDWNAVRVENTGDRLPTYDALNLFQPF
jgi:signal transduction histidine kinase